MVRQAHLIAVVGAFLMGCAGLLMVVGCAVVRSEAPEEQQGHTEATREQTHSDRCGGTRTVKLQGRTYTTNDVSGCPKGGLLSGTDEQDKLAGQDGEDEVRGLGGSDTLSGGFASDVIYGGPGNDDMEAGPAQIGWHIPPPDRSMNVLHGGPGNDGMNGDAGDDVLYGDDGDDKFIWGGMKGADVLYGGDGNDFLNGASDVAGDTQPNKLYCGKGRDEYVATKIDYVSSSCEEVRRGGPGGQLAAPIIR